MTDCIIVAIPRSEEMVWKVSSEKVPHMTLLFLGELDLSEIDHIKEYLYHATTVANPSTFYMNVDERGVLGDEKADVLFFKKNQKNVVDFRANLLQDPVIFKAYNRIDQYPEWTPHLTMGYPKSPAKKDTREYPYWGYIEFDRIALWSGEYEGPTFKLESPKPTLTEEVTMSDPTVGNFLEHFGIKGMRWGVRRNDGNPVEVSLDSQPGSKVTTKGGYNQPASEDAKKVAVSKQKAKTSSTDSLSTKELQELVNRMNLEQQYSKLTSKNTSLDNIIPKPVMDFAKPILKEKAQKIAGDYITKQVGNYMKKKAA